MGGEDEKVLSQHDVDALIALMPEQPPSSGKAGNTNIEKNSLSPGPPEPKSVTAEAGESPSSQNNILSQIAGIQSTLAAYSSQFDKLTNIIQRLDLMEDKIRKISKTVDQLSNDENLQSEQVTEIKTRLREYQKSKSELKDKFQCGVCNSKGHMAFAVKCTVCGEEDWFGWWPKKQ